MMGKLEEIRKHKDLKLKEDSVRVTQKDYLDVQVENRTGLSRDTITIRFFKANKRIDIADMPKKDEFINESKEEIRYYCDTGNVIQILECWLKFLDNLEQKVREEAQGLDDMFEF